MSIQPGQEPSTAQKPSTSRKTIRVVRPDFEGGSETISLAARELPDEGALGVLTLIDNGKPNAKQLLLGAAEAVKKILPLAEVSVHTKPSASAALDARTADLIAARSRMVISGVGD